MSMQLATTSLTSIPVVPGFVVAPLRPKVRLFRSLIPAPSQSQLSAQMGEIAPAEPVANDPEDLISQTKPPKPRRVLTLPPFPPLTYTTQFVGMTASPSSSRRRAALTPSQAFHHASGSFFAPEPHGHEDWIFRTTDTIPEASNSGSSTSSSDPSSKLMITVATTPVTVSTTVIESSPTPSPPCAIEPVFPRPRAYSHNPMTGSGVPYSSAHRRVPSSPSFRSTPIPYVHAYFDRPPSPTSSISSRSSEPPMPTSLSLSELLAGSARMSLGGYGQEDPAERARREEMREERRLAMVERHAAVIEHREKKRWARTSQAGSCVEWVDSSKKYSQEW